MSDAADIEGEMGITDKLLTRILQGLDVGQRITPKAKKALMDSYDILLDHYTAIANEYDREQKEADKRSKYIIENGKKTIIGVYEPERFINE